MAKEQLIVEIDAKTGALTAKMDEAKGGVYKLGTEVEKTDRKTSRLSQGFNTLERGTEKLSAGIGTLATGMAAMGAAAIASAKLLGDMSKEIRINAELSKLGAEEFQLYAYAMREQGIELDKLGDITKDTSERLGDFINTGGGGLQDFADAMGYSAEQTREFAKEFSGLSGIEILQEMANRMESVGASEEQMSHALEGMSSDVTLLMPLLENGGEKMKDFMDEAERSGTVFSDERLTQMEAMGKQVDLLGRQSQQTAALGLAAVGSEFMGIVAAAPATISAIGSIGTAISAMIAAGFADLIFNAGDWWDSLKSFQADMEGGFAGTIADGLEALGMDSTYFRENEQQWTNYGSFVEGEREKQRQAHEAGMQLLQETIDTEMANGLASIEQAKEAYATAYQEFEDLKVEQTERNEEAAAESAESEEETEAEKNERVLAEIEAQWAQHNRKLSGIHQQGYDLFKKYEDDKVKGSLSALDMIASATASNSKTMFYAQQGAKAGLAIMNTAEGITEALPNYPLAIAVGLSGAAQLATILSASPSGGSSAAPAPTAPAPAQSDFAADTQGLETSGSISFGGETVGDVGGNAVVEVDGDSTMQLLGGIIEQGINNGSIKFKGI